MSGTEPYYVRYMDDVLVLTKTRWQLRRAVRTLNQTFAELKFHSTLRRPSSAASSENLIFSGIAFATDRYGSRNKRSRTTQHGFIGFMSSRKRHPQVPLVWMST